MLQITLPKARFFNEETEEFVEFEPLTVKLEHSLISIQKWESKWHKSYLSSESFTPEEIKDYIRCMSLDSNVDPLFPQRLTSKDFKSIKEYIENPMTATTFGKQPEKGGRKQIITAEIVYYWMTAFGIPFSCAKWHINQLLTLIEVCSIKNNPSKGGKKQSAAQRAALNKARRAKLGSSG